MQSPIYWHPLLYHTAMKLSYKDRFETRYSALARYIPEGSQVLEICMGDSYFYRNYLKTRCLDYACADINPVFVRHAKQLGLKADVIDIGKDPIPSADIILLHGSLYHFIPFEKKLIEKLLAACKSKVIISESTENLSNASNPLQSFIGATLSKAKSGQSKIKFTRDSLRVSFAAFEKHIEVWEESPDNREIIIVLKK